jgi:hypothetical protein
VRLRRSDAVPLRSELKRNGRFKEIEALLPSDPRFALEHATSTSSIDPLWWESVIERVWWLEANTPEKP